MKSTINSYICTPVLFVAVTILLTSFAIAQTEDNDNSATLSAISKLRDGSEAEKIAAARFLGGKREQTALPALIEALRDKSIAVRAESASSLGLIGDAEAVPNLCRLLAETNLKNTKVIKHVSVVGAATTALGLIGNDAAFECATNELQGEEIRQLFMVLTITMFNSRPLTTAFLQAEKKAASFLRPFYSVAHIMIEGELAAEADNQVIIHQFIMPDDPSSVPTTPGRKLGYLADNDVAAINGSQGLIGELVNKKVDKTKIVFSRRANLARSGKHVTCKLVAADTESKGKTDARRAGKFFASLLTIGTPLAFGALALDESAHGTITVETIVTDGATQKEIARFTTESKYSGKSNAMSGDIAAELIKRLDLK
jgi:hypothetical protein